MLEGKVDNQPMSKVFECLDKADVKVNDTMKREACDQLTTGYENKAQTIEAIKKYVKTPQGNSFIQQAI